MDFVQVHGNLSPQGNHVLFRSRGEDADTFHNSQAGRLRINNADSGAFIGYVKAHGGYGGRYIVSSGTLDSAMKAELNGPAETFSVCPFLCLWSDAS